MMEAQSYRETTDGRRWVAGAPAPSLLSRKGRYGKVNERGERM